MSAFLQRFLADESGASTAEYAILLAAVGAAAALAVGVFSTGLSSMFTTLTSKMAAWVT
jgi:Flp pilus assembly pilin Flp